MGGAWLCSLVSSVAYSAGSASGMVASSCATFMIGPFKTAERGGKPERIGGAILRHAEQTRAGHARGHAADFGADLGIAFGASGEAILFVIRGRRHDQAVLSKASSSPMRLAITLKPPSQNFGSRASSPNGASNSL